LLNFPGNEESRFPSFVLSAQSGEKMASFPTLMAFYGTQRAAIEMVLTALKLKRTQSYQAKGRRCVP